MLTTYNTISVVDKDPYSIYHLNYNSGQNIWSEIQKSSKTGRVKKSSTSTFGSFLTAIATV